jgi:peptidoglycan/xylan/chitin deacetylase (PgdA/CDA1 family)
MSLARAKNSMKKGLRRVFATLNGLGLGLLLRKLGCARGGGIVMTHCVGHVPETAYLPRDMKTSCAKVDALLRALKRRGVKVVAVRDLVAALDRGEDARDLLAFTMDDGYRDNYTQALPLLKRYDASGTVFVETEVVGTRTPSWMHRYFYICAKRGEEFLADEYARRSGEEAVRAKLQQAKSGSSGLGARYDLKRVLKYDADPRDRDRVTRAILESIGGDDAAIANAYLTWDEVAALDAAGVEIGAHTLHHEILSRLDRNGVEREIAGSTRAIAERVKHPVVSFAYPFGRRWDYNDDCFDVLRDLGYTSASAAIDGTNDPSTDRLQLKRLPLNDDIPIEDVLAEIDGTFPLVRKLFRVQI